MIIIPRPLFGFHLALVGCVLLVWCGGELGWYGRGPFYVSIAVAVAAVFLVRPRFVLTASGVRFVAKVLYVFSIPYAAIERERIVGIKVGWDREHNVKSTGGVAYSYRRPFIGVFLECLRKDTGKVSTFRLEEAKDMDAARKRGEEFARVLGRPLRIK